MPYCWGYYISHRCMYVLILASQKFLLITSCEIKHEIPLNSKGFSSKCSQMTINGYKNKMPTIQRAIYLIEQLHQNQKQPNVNPIQLLVYWGNSLTNPPQAYNFLNNQSKRKSHPFNSFWLQILFPSRFLSRSKRTNSFSNEPASEPVNSINAGKHLRDEPYVFALLKFLLTVNV